MNFVVIFLVGKKYKFLKKKHYKWFCDHIYPVTFAQLKLNFNIGQNMTSYTVVSEWEVIKMLFSHNMACYIQDLLWGVSYYNENVLHRLFLAQNDI